MFLADDLKNDIIPPCCCGCCGCWFCCCGCCCCCCGGGGGASSLVVVPRVSGVSPRSLTDASTRIAAPSVRVPPPALCSGKSSSAAAASALVPSGGCVPSGVVGSGSFVSPSAASSSSVVDTTRRSCAPAAAVSATSGALSSAPRESVGVCEGVGVGGLSPSAVSRRRNTRRGDGAGVCTAVRSAAAATVSSGLAKRRGADSRGSCASCASRQYQTPGGNVCRAQKTSARSTVAAVPRAVAGMSTAACASTSSASPKYGLRVLRGTGAPWHCAGDGASVGAHARYNGRTRHTQPALAVACTASTTPAGTSAQSRSSTQSPTFGKSVMRVWCFLGFM